MSQENEELSDSHRLGHTGPLDHGRTSRFILSADRIRWRLLSESDMIWPPCGEKVPLRHTSLTHSELFSLNPISLLFV